MKRIVVVVLAMLFWVLPAQGRENVIDAEGLRISGEQGFKEILTLWRDGRHDELYRHTTKAGSHTREYFVAKLAEAGKKPSCCWEMAQDVSVKVKNDAEVEVRATVGLETLSSRTEHSTRSFRLLKENGIWKIPMNDILSLAGATKKKTSKSKKKKKSGYEG
ncbi:MAG: hypothetical protein HYS23_08885 [Geobacter sp.]|nr:hypothetical protein [Geobacter sp.]